jgi:hypothetical protein
VAEEPPDESEVLDRLLGGHRRGRQAETGARLGYGRC